MTLADLLEALLEETDTISLEISRSDIIQIVASDRYGETVDGRGATMDKALQKFTENAEEYVLERQN